MNAYHSRTSWGARAREKLKQLAERLSPLGIAVPADGEQSSPSPLRAEDRPDRLHDREGLPDARPIRTSVWYLNRARVIWKIIVASLLVEGVILSAGIAVRVVAPIDFARNTEILAWTLFGFAAIFLAGPSVLRWSDRLFTLLQRVATYQRLNSWLVPLLVTAYAILELGRKFEYFGPIMIVVLAIVGIVAWRALAKQGLDEGARLDEIMRDPLRWIELRNYQNFLLSLAPALAARLGVLLFGVHTFVEGGTLVEFLPYLSIGIVLMVANQPQMSTFMAQCRGCARWTSRALHFIGCCPQCAPQIFYRAR